MQLLSWVATEWQLRGLTEQERAEMELRAKARKEKIEKGRYDVIYANDLAEANKLLNTVKGLRGAEAKVAEMEGQIEEAKKKAANDDFKGACESHLATVPGLAKEARAAADIVAIQFANRFPEQQKFAKTVRIQIQQTKFVPADVKEQLQNHIESTLEPLYLPKADEIEGQKAQTLLQGVSDACTMKEKGYQAEQLSATEEVNKARIALANLLEVGATERDTALLKREIDAIESMIGNREYDKATTACKEVTASLAKLRVQIVADKEEWDVLKSKIASCLDDCATLKNSACPLVKKEAPTIVEAEKELLALQKRNPPTDISFVEAITQLKRCQEQVAINKDRDSRFGLFADSRKSADDEVRKELRAVQQAGDHLRDKAEERVKRDDQEHMFNIETFGRFQTEMEQLAARWNKALAIATCDDDIKVKDEIINLLKALVVKINDAARGDDGQRSVANDNQMGQARTSYDKVLADCRSALEDYVALGPPADKIKLFETQIKRNEVGDETVDARFLKERQDALAELAKTIGGTAEEFKEVILGAQFHVKFVRAAAKSALEEFQGLIKTYQDSWLKYVSDSGLYEQYAKQFETEIERYEGMETVLDMEVLESAITDLQRIRKLCNDGKTALKNQTLPKDLPTMEGLGTTIDNLASQLDHADLTDYLSGSKEILKTELDDLKANMVKVPMDVTNQKLADWQKTFTAKTQEAAVAKSSYEQFEKEQKALKLSLADNKARFEPLNKDYYKRLAKQIDGLPAAAKKEGGMDTAKLDCERIKVELNNALTNSAAMKNGQDLAMTIEGDAERDTKVWEELYKDYKERTLPEIKGLEPAASLYDELVTLGKMAHEAFGKTKDLASAKFQLNNAKERAEWIKKYPQGKQAAGRGEFTTVQARWKGAVAALRKELGELTDKVATGAPEARPGVQQALDKVGNLFNSAGFDATINALVASNNPNIRAAKREVGLGLVRRYRIYLLKDNRFKLLKKNPFAPVDSLNLINRALFEMDKVLQISM